MGRGRRVERVLAVVGAATVLVVGFDAVTFAATGSSLLLGRVNQAGATTTVQNTGAGAALNLVTKSVASPPFTTNAKGLVPNLRASTADRLAGLTLAQVRAGAIPAAPRTHLVGQPGEPAFVTPGNAPGLYGWDNYGNGFSPVSFRKDQLGVVPLAGLLCPRAVQFVGGPASCAGFPAGTTPAQYTVTTLPAGFRPASRAIFAVDDTEHLGRVDVLSDGEVDVLWDGTVPHSYISLDGISFVATH